MNSLTVGIPGGPHVWLSLTDPTATDWVHRPFINTDSFHLHSFHEHINVIVAQ